MEYEYQKDKVVIDDATEAEYNTAVVADARVVADDDTMTDDAKTGATLGGAGGAITGAIAGSMAGPAGAVIGAVAGGIVGAVASGAAVQAVDSIDNDGSSNEGLHVSDAEVETVHRGAGEPMIVPGTPHTGAPKTAITDTRDVTEQIADALTGDPYDDKTGRRIDRPGDPNDLRPMQPRNTDTRGTMEKVADAMTGDPYDDKTGQRVTNDTRSMAEKAADAMTGDKYDDKTGRRIDD